MANDPQINDQDESTAFAQTQVVLALFSYSETRLGEVIPLFNPLAADGSLRFVKAGPAHLEQLWCDLVCVLYDPGVKIEEFTQDIASLKLVRKIPIVLALVFESDRLVIEENKFEMAADFVIYLPLPADQFSKTIMLHVVTHRLNKQREASRSDYGRTSHSLGEILVQNRLITPLQLKKALDHQKHCGKRLGDALVELGFIDEDQKLHFLSFQLNVPVATARQYAGADLNVVALIPEHVARRYNCIALEKKETDLLVAMTDVLDLRLLDNLRDITELTIRPMLGKLDDITTSMDRFYRDISSHKDASNLLADLDEGKMEFVESKQDEVNLEEIAAAGAELGIIKLVNMLIGNGVRDRASDIHIEPQDKELVVRYRIDGDMRRVMSPPKHSHQPIIARIKILSNLDIAERRLPQDGRMVVKMGKREVDIRVSILPTIFGEKAVLRILDKEAFEKSVSNLGFSANDQSIFRTQINKPYGMIIVTGPTGSGKSTTLYSAVQAIKNVTKNIITVEDPVEFHMDGINQVHVNTKIGLTFASSLRSILRQDPDIVLIGEIRDNETADIAVKMALTGHLVFSTLHTNDAASSIARFVDIGIPPLLLGSSLNLIIAQRLVRRICPKCKVEFVPPAEMLDHLNLTPNQSHKFFRGEGCVACNGSGYTGRIGIFEFLVVSREIRKLILRNSPTLEIQEQAERDGMNTLRKSGIALALQGDTTIEQVIAATTEI
jgi:type IV pilus assembly protein PilB